MSKRREYFAQLEPLLFEQSIEKMEQLLLKNSNLPGPRGNLELADAFADHFYTGESSTYKWNLLQRLLHTILDDKPHENPAEFLPFCALIALGSFYTQAATPIRSEIVLVLWKYANHTNWRLREGVAMAFQRIAEHDFELIRDVFSAYLTSASLLELRAIMAALAHPPILKNTPNVVFCMETSDLVLNKVLNLDATRRKTEEFRVLRQGLEYALSVFVAALPNEGFLWLAKWAKEEDPDVRKVLKSNLGKTRLTKSCKERVEEVLRVINGGV